MRACPPHLPSPVWLCVQPADTSELLERLEDSLMTLGSMATNRYAAPFRAEVQGWIRCGRGRGRQRERQSTEGSSQGVSMLSPALRPAPVWRRPAGRELWFPLPLAPPHLPSAASCPP